MAQDWQRSTEQEGSVAVKTAHVSFLIDRSGSMQSIRSDVIGGFNRFLEDQRKQEGECLLSLYQFDDGGFDCLFDGMSIHEVRDADDADFVPRGNTPLLDAIGKLITRASIRKESPEGKDEQPIIVVLTDGLENASHEYTREAIKKLIEQKEAEGYAFSFLAANQDAFLSGGSMGFHRNSTQNFVPDSHGVSAAYASVSSAVSASRSSLSMGKTVTSSNLYDGATTDAQDDWASRSTATYTPPNPIPPSTPKTPTPRSWKKS